ncbi:MAG TPA: hypothetical protein VM533_20700 [Fimbriiglobus sp.]|jgi:hypothetical protein|nr:hypothetical protein [Fimbriiglobus sp.]
MAKSSRKGTTVYLVERAACTVSDYGGKVHYGVSSGDDEGGPSHVPVRAFADKKAAQACRKELEAEARRDLCPALFAGYALPKDLAAKLKAIGLTSLKFTGPDYNHGEQLRKWWVAHAAEMTPQQRAAVWDQLKSVSFYRVTETTLEG